MLQRENGKAPCWALRNFDPEQEQGATSPLLQPEGNSDGLPGSCWTDLLSRPEQLAPPLGCLLPWSQVQYQGQRYPAEAGALQWESCQS